MVAYNSSILNNWQNNGYRYILVLPRDKYGVLRPLAYEKPVKKGYVIELNEISLIQMAEDYFFTKEKDARLVDVPSRLALN